MQPLISIIVPVYNVEAYIDDCLYSIRNQTYPNLEIIVVDDGSTDGSLQRIWTHVRADSRMVLVRQENGGVAAARNKGLQHMQGKLVMFADSDDVMEPDAVAFLWEKMQSAQVDIVVGNAVNCNEDGSIKAQQPAGRRFDYFEKRMDTHEEMLLWLMAKTDEIDIICQMAVVFGHLYRREVVENIRFPVGIMHEDEAVNYRYLLNAKSVLYVSKVVTHYRIRTGSLMQYGSAVSLKRLEDFVSIMWERWRILHELGLDDILNRRFTLSMPDYFGRHCLRPLLAHPDFARLPPEKQSYYGALKLGLKYVLDTDIGA